MHNERNTGRVIFRDWEKRQQGDLQPEDLPPDKALQTAAAFLMDFGRYAFDLDQVESEAVHRLCKSWAAHLLAGSPPPGRRAVEGRDWDGAQRFVRRQRRQEQLYVRTSIRDLRNMIWEFIQGVSRTVAEDRQSDSHVEKRLARLKEVVQRESIEELRREVLEAVHTIGEAIEERQERQRSRMLQLGERLRRMRCELVDAREKMSTDPLTRLYNRSAFDEHLKRTADLCLFSGQPACLMMMDLDHFKAVNDGFGHMAGDAVLCSLADCCVRSFPRKSDFVARYGGEEFAVIISDAGANVCRNLAAGLVEAVRKMDVVHEGNNIPVTVSIGVAELSAGDTAESWLRRADEALYQAKAGGRNRCVVKSR